MIGQAAQDWRREELRRGIGGDEQCEDEVGLSEISYHEWQDRYQQRAADGVHERQKQDGPGGARNLLKHMATLASLMGSGSAHRTALPARLLQSKPFPRTLKCMSTFKGPSEGGSGGKRGHRNMEHWGFNDEVKDAARARRRLDDRDRSQQRSDEPIEWTLLPGARAQHYAEEAIVEIAPGHELAGHEFTAVSTCPACDDVLFRVGDGSFVIVHLTWSGEQERPPWPRTTRLAGFVAAELAIAQHDH